MHEVALTLWLSGDMPNADALAELLFNALHTTETSSVGVEGVNVLSINSSITLPPALPQGLTS